MLNNPRSIGAFRVNVYHHSSTDPVAEYVGTGAEWRLKSVLRAPIGEYSYSVSVDSVWVELLQGQQNHIEEEVEGLCTIIKFGDTMQLREPFRVVVEINL